MSTEMTMADLVAMAKVEPDSNWKPKQKFPYPVKVIDSNYLVEPDGTRKWGVKVEITEGDSKGQVAWTNIKFHSVENRQFLNAGSFRSMLALGIPEAAIVGDTGEVLAGMFIGKSALASAVASYKERDSDDPRFFDWSFEARKAQVLSSSSSNDGESAEADDSWMTA